MTEPRPGDYVRIVGTEHKGRFEWSDSSLGLSRTSVLVNGAALVVPSELIESVSPLDADIESHNGTSVVVRRSGLPGMVAYIELPGIAVQGHLDDANTRLMATALQYLIDGGE